MKKKFILMLTLLAGVLSANADNKISVISDVSSNGTGFIAINLDNTDVVQGYQFDVTLPEGFEFVLDSDDNPVFSPGERTGKLVIGCSIVGGKARFICADSKTTGTTLLGNTGPLLYIKIKTTLTSGKGEASLNNIVLTRQNSGGKPEKDHDFDDKVIGFDANVFDGVVLYENDTENPAKKDGTNVKVYRTIKAGEWSTLCLPFDMTATQVKAAFGDDVELKDFNGAEASTELIKVSFVDATAIQMNVPCLIKVNSDVSVFTAENVNVQRKGTTKKVGEEAFTGTYIVTTVPDECVFLSGNKFYYSTNKTAIKGFRGWFKFSEILDDFWASRGIELDFGDGTTGINAVRQLPNDGNYYNLKGQRVEKPSKGVFIVNGKKVVVK